MRQEELISQMMLRVEQCRRLAAGMIDQKTIDALLKMAAEGEATIAQIKAEGMSD